MPFLEKYVNFSAMERNFTSRGQSGGFGRGRTGASRSAGPRSNYSGGARGGFSGGPSFGGAPRPSYGGAPRSGGFGGARRPSYGSGSRPSYGDKPSYGGARGGSSYGPRPSYGNRQEGGYSPRPSYGGAPRPAYGGGDRGGYSPRPSYGPRRDFGGDNGGQGQFGQFKPQTSYGSGYKGTPPSPEGARVEGAFGNRPQGPRAPRYNERESAQSYSAPRGGRSYGDAPRAPRDSQAGNRTRGFIKESSQDKVPVAPPTFPMRINRYLALQKKASRRDADRLIEAGRVMLNDKKAKLGDKVNEGDSIAILSADDARTDRQTR